MAPPNNECTGTFKYFPLISSKAFSIAAIACCAIPPGACLDEAYRN